MNLYVNYFGCEMGKDNFEILIFRYWKSVPKLWLKMAAVI